ncbi:MAG: hypothetical protein JWO18_1727 [Microbacteriaceae bacterium]|jgi:hypothetical protein|nr:hypothetical protein [Microbacteriaceae bacterium]
MNDNQVPKVFTTPLKKRIAVGAASVLTAGALLGAGVAGASASPLGATSDSSTSPSGSSTHQAGSDSRSAFGASLEKQIRAAFFQGTVAGAKAQKLAAEAVGQTALFATLPSALQADLTALKNASPTGRDAAAQKVTTTALDGGYGAEVKRIATGLSNGTKHPLIGVLRDELRADLSAGQDAGQSAGKIATTLLDDTALFAVLPANLQADLTALKNAPAAVQTVDALKAESTALAGGYGQQIQKIAEQLLSKG